MSKDSYALLSVSDKNGIVDFAKSLDKLGIKILSTGGTAKTLRDANIPCIEVADFTGSKEIFDGRVKTLHPKIHGGILNIRDNADHQKTATENGIENIDIVAVNLYPFESTVLNPASTFEDIIENIDIGGPAMIRSAAKNHPSVTVIVSPSDYDIVITELNTGNTSLDLRKRLAAKAFSHTSLYDSVISNYLNNQFGIKFPEEFTSGGRLIQPMRYGENPHQNAAFYQEPLMIESAITNTKQLHGKELSFNNIVDLNSAYELIKEFDKPSAVIIKHNNPCGVAEAEDLYTAYMNAYKTDTLSAFGGIVGLNRNVDMKLAAELSKIFLEAVIAPSFSDDAFKLLSSKPSIRLMLSTDIQGRSYEYDIKRVVGGMLLQDRDLHTFSSSSFKSLSIPTKRKPTKEEFLSLEFAWKVAKHVKSNTIVYAKDKSTIGIGAGQMSRIDSTQLAAMKAENAFGSHAINGSVMASDAFFPFRDNIDAAAEYGVTAIVSPGGSVRDDEVIAACDEHNIAMVFTSIRHFKH